MRWVHAWCCGVAARFNDLDMGGGGNCTTWRFDTPATRRDGTSNAAKPRWVDSPHVVSPQARVERRADLRNKLVRMIEVVPADADDVPALGFEVALTLALAGQ